MIKSQFSTHHPVVIAFVCFCRRDVVLNPLPQVILRRCVVYWTAADVP